MIDLDAMERLLADEIYEQDDLGDDELNINGWLGDIEAGDATIDEMLEAICPDEEQRNELKQRIQWIDGFETFDTAYDAEE